MPANLEEDFVRRDAAPKQRIAGEPPPSPVAKYEVGLTPDSARTADIARAQEVRPNKPPHRRPRARGGHRAFNGRGPLIAGS
jgi:hypothetical protein